RVELPQLLRGRRQSPRIRLTNDKSVLGDLSRQGEVRWQRYFAVMFDGIRVGSQGSRHSAGQRAGLAETQIRLAVAQKHLAPGGGRGFLAPVDGDHGTV